MIAVERKVTSAVGDLYNDVSDRFSDAAILIGAGYAAGGEPILGYIATCLAILTASIRTAGKAAGAHQEHCGPMAKPQRMAAITFASLYSGLPQAVIQPRIGNRGWGAIGLALVVIVVGEIVTVSRRLVRIARALRSQHP